MRVAIFLVIAVALIGTVGCTTGYHETTLLHCATVVGHDWLTLRFPKPLKATPNWEQEILVSVSSQHNISTQGKFGLRMPDGAIIWPECQIATENGEWLPLTGRGFWGEDLSIGDRALSGNSQSYVAVKIRSAEPITVSRIVWNSYDPREVKR